MIRSFVNGCGVVAALFVILASLLLAQAVMDRGLGAIRLPGGATGCDYVGPDSSC